MATERKYVKKIGKNTRIWVTIYNGDDEYKITSSADRSRYTVLKKCKTNPWYEIIGSGADPFELEEKHIWKKGKKKK